MRMQFLPTTIAVWIAAWASLVAACGASNKEIHTARNSGYRTDFVVVYSETLSAVRDLYPSLIEDARAGLIKTRWHPVNVEQDSTGKTRTTGTQGMSQTGQASAFQSGTSVSKVYFVRFEVKVVGGKPWRVRVTGYASSWTPGEIPTPLKGAEIPAWLAGRVSSLEVDIYRRLQKYAVPMPPAGASAEPEPEPEPEPVDLAKYGELPQGAAEVIAKVEAAVTSRTPSELRSLMSDEFTYSFGGDNSADTAIAVWQADPTLLSELGKTLAAGCAKEPQGQRVVCPAAYLTDPSFLGYRAGFQAVGDTWKMIFFVAGD